jgi:hypothetical protein
MALDLVPTGKDVPNDINVIIEIPKDADPVKYEVDKSTGAIFVDRILSTPMRYPCNYGYIPHTLCGDGDPPSGRRHDDAGRGGVGRKAAGCAGRPGVQRVRPRA